MSSSEQIEIIWHVDDVLERCEELGITMSRDKALDVLHTIKNRHDANLGINWTVIDCHIEEYTQ